MDKTGSGSDVKPGTLLGDGSVRALERESGLGPIDARRFRMLIQFTSEKGHIEDTWECREVKVGTARTALSTREREVAEQVAAGKTNRAIADALFLSQKTVESHLARIYDKIDARSRVTLAALITRERQRNGM